MFIFYRLFDYCVNRSTRPDGAASSSSLTQSPTSDRLFLIWWAAFGASLFFRLAAELALRFLLFAACVLLISTLDGSLNLLTGHAVLKTARYAGYEPSILSSLEVGALGGVIVMGPFIIAAVFLIALFNIPKPQQLLSSHIALLLELAVAVAISTAACSTGALVALHVYLDRGPSLDPTHAARAGALGACLLTVPVVSTAALLTAQSPTFASTPNESPPIDLDHSHCTLPLPIINQSITTPHTRSRKPLIVHTTAETVGYVLITLCILTIRLLCL